MEPLLVGDEQKIAQGNENEGNADGVEPIDVLLGPEDENGQRVKYVL
jgi:hypothetical protein